MSAYFLRRLLMVPITFLVITFLVYTVLRFVPGGPIEQAEAQLRLGGQEGAGGGSASAAGGQQLQMSPEGLQHLAVYYALDRSVPVGYLQWLGLWPREQDSWIPPVPAERHPEAYQRLTKLSKASDDAQQKLTQQLQPHRATVFEGKLYRIVDAKTLPADVRNQASLLLQRSFPQRYALEAYLAQHGYAWKTDARATPLYESQHQSFAAEQKIAQGDALQTGQFLEPLAGGETPAWLADAKPLLADANQAQAALDRAEAEEGYVLLRDGPMLQRALLPLQRLNAVRDAADARLGDWLAPHDLVAYEGHVYRRLTQQERDSKALKPFFDGADRIQARGFAARPKLLTFLSARGYTSAGGHYYARVGTAALGRLQAYLGKGGLFAQDGKTYAPADSSACGPGAGCMTKNGRRYKPVSSATVKSMQEFFDTAAALIGARDLARRKLASLQASTGVKIDTQGRMYKVSHELAGILELRFGDSYQSNQPVISVMLQRIGVSLPYVLTGYLLSWIICIPLGVIKAIKHTSLFDNLSSIFVFIGYAVPGFVVALILLVAVASHVSWLPIGGYMPPNAEQLGFGALLWAKFRYMLIPVIAYTAGSFATMTILMKNSLLENLGQDYVRTAFAKGLSERRVIYVHALRNSLIPITAGIGNAFAILFAGSFLIEQTCNIPGMGLLGYTSILNRDYPVVMGLMVFGVIIQLFGNILSDIIWAAIDPRIRFST
jgi:microcin C transport system permease protein